MPGGMETQIPHKNNIIVGIMIAANPYKEDHVYFIMSVILITLLLVMVWSKGIRFTLRVWLDCAVICTVSPSSLLDFCVK